MAKWGDGNSRAGSVSPTNFGGYKPPTGGGGVTDSVTVKDVTVYFGHGGRHLEGTGVSEADMNNAIANDVVNRSLPSGHATRFPITVHGIDFCYSAIQLGANHINIGTYYPVIKLY